MNVKSVLPSFIGENTYEFILIDYKTNKIKQKVVSHNLITNFFWKCQGESLNQYHGGNPNLAGVSSIALGSGTGIVSETDEYLFNYLWEKRFENHTINISEDKRTAEIVMTATFPANADYVGNITEAGLLEPTLSPRIKTHSLLKDSEGNAISINKTENDKMKVTVTFKMSTPKKDGNFNYVDIDKGIFKKILDCSGSRDPSSSGGLAKSSMGLLRNKEPKSTSLDINLGLGTKNASKDLSTIKKVVYNTQRMEVGIGNNHYYFCLAINGIGYYTLPNKEVFPPYAINNIEIGIGDGIKTKFKNPLNYFMKDTDIIYINGKPKQRGVDYTIDNENNFDMLNELSACQRVKRRFSECKDKYSSTFPIFSVPEGVLGNHDYRDSDEKEGFVLKENIPLLIELETPEKINTCYIGGLTWANRYNNRYATNIKIKLEYSLNNKDYKDVFTSETFNSLTGKKFIFKEIEAKYWKITATYIEASEVIFVNGQLYDEEDKKAFISPFLGYVGDDQITFKTPPALNDIITMDVKMDIPFKNENYSIDTSATLEFV